MRERGSRLLAAIAVLAGCGGGAASYYGGDSTTASASPSGRHAPGSGVTDDMGSDADGIADEADEPMRIAEREAAPPGVAEGSTGGIGWRAFEDDRVGGELVRPEASRQRQMIAQTRPQPRRQTPPPPTPPTTQPEEQQTATDTTSGPLLIYEAILNLAVYQVQDNQRAVIEAARELGGYLARQDDQTVVIRVPADKFREAIAKIEALGDVLHRNIQATDVSEEFRDARIRLRNMEQVRDRLAALLEDARNVEESLRIERELERLTTQIELIKGRLRFLEDRIAFSTITVNFSPKEEESLEGEIFHLPFDWLYNLGLRRLMNLR